MSNREHNLKQQIEHDHHFYNTYPLFEKGSWLEKPSPAIQRYIPVIQKTPQSQVLDLGAGPGRHAIPVAQAIVPEQGKVTAVDHLPLAIEQLSNYARQYGVEDHIHPVLQRAEEMEVPVETYDWIFAVNLLEYLPSQETVEALLSRLEAGVRPKRYVTIVLDVEVENGPVQPGWRPAAEAARKTLRRAFTSWRVVVEKTESASNRKTITFLAQKE
ncbi:class I SAM-dependent methyltransferase [Salibacterium aidingense]|uniref:class I SAM-dependent methyltransferase n=1 Tax=Salibacterium aidingense TaxID=384933 RepID=UPI003BD3A471